MKPVSEAVVGYLKKGDGGRVPLAAAGALRLYRGAFDRSERAENTAVAGIGSQERAAARALVIELAGVGWHGLRFREAALGAREDRLENEGCHGLGVEG